MNDLKNEVDDEWSRFLQTPDDNEQIFLNNSSVKNTEDEEIPECEELYISTKTKVLFLNQHIDIFNVFWKIPVINYWEPNEGVIKKQIKIVSNSEEELQEYQEKIKDINYYTENIIKQINTTNMRGTRYKDERKITIGISKKDIMNCRGKVKNAFYNCFAIIVRFKYQDAFREIHVKIFNTGKLEIPGILNDELLEIIKVIVLKLIKTYSDEDIDFVEQKVEANVLINSNFNCGFYINRDLLQTILRGNKYNIETSYDPCSYPGVKCKYYYNNLIEKEKQTGEIEKEDRETKLKDLNINNKYTEVSFMIFRTGSCLIVGNCNEEVLNHVYEFIKNMLQNEYFTIRVTNNITTTKVKKSKVRKKTIIINQQYYNDVIHYT
jgi:TATA-box binding protein (TBP) (component of TFIID and TFIIIB)